LLETALASLFETVLRCGSNLFFRANQWLPPTVSRTADARIDNSWQKNIHELAITRPAETDAILVLTDREEQQTPSQKLSVIQNWFAEFKERKK
jgi:hypothetical protein